jgi:hypothetical protein
MLPISARQSALSTQLSLLSQSLRFAVRAVRTRDLLVVCDGLRKARLTREELRFLELAAHSAQHLRATTRASTTRASRRRPPATAWQQLARASN